MSKKKKKFTFLDKDHWTREEVMDYMGITKNTLYGYKKIGLEFRIKNKLIKKVDFFKWLETDHRALLNDFK